MPNRVKIVIVNDTDFPLLQPSDGNDFVMTFGELDPGSGLPPAVIDPHQTCDFTVHSPINGPGPEGWFRRTFGLLNLSVSVNWADATQTRTSKAKDIEVPDPADPSKTVTEKGVEGAVNPFTCAWKLLDGGYGELVSKVGLSSERGTPIAVEGLAQYHEQDQAEQAKRNKQGLPSALPLLLVVKYTLSVKGEKLNVAAPAVQPAVMPKGVVRPTGGARMVIGTPYRTWDAPGISARRKRLLAILGHIFPQTYVPDGEKLSGAEPACNIPYQPMNWTPKYGGTSCTTVNGGVEEPLTGKAGKWAFTAYLLEEAWVPWGANPAKPMPNAGDLYILYRDLLGPDPKKDTYAPHTQHVGFIVHVPEKPGEDWVTADGGQGKLPAQFAFLNRRPWELRVPEPAPGKHKEMWDAAMRGHVFARPIKDTPYPYLAGGAESSGGLPDANRLIGWIDMDSPALNPFKEGFDMAQDVPLKIRQDRRYTEYDYQFLGAWIDAMLGKRTDVITQWLAHLKNPTANAPPWQPSGAAPSTPPPSSKP